MTENNFFINKRYQEFSLMLICNSISKQIIRFKSFDQIQVFQHHFKKHFLSFLYQNSHKIQEMIVFIIYCCLNTKILFIIYTTAYRPYFIINTLDSLYQNNSSNHLIVE
ncbi:hypothetical protein pb186bvf_012809 [Paramecium bursaria]